MKMDRIYGIFGLAALVIVAVAVGLAVDAGAYERKSNREKRVRVDVKPVQLTPGQPAKFEVQMNTHSETLGEDMVAVSSLKDNLGRIYQATTWQGSGPGGHHREGVLEFPKLADNTESITLIIRKVADVSERTFEWSVEH
ncbi:hypothetical protein D1BOALGB6SA_4263 [Olavius sp. associated proteobacterium Delta 1]|nr:hypothetical protein D1BOALGB6SA_4263 [Olavius sp. associated proteobacterium Delta 1]